MLCMISANFEEKRAISPRLLTGGKNDISVTLKEWKLQELKKAHSIICFEVAQSLYSTKRGCYTPNIKALAKFKYCGF